MFLSTNRGFRGGAVLEYVPAAIRVKRQKDTEDRLPGENRTNTLIVSEFGCFSPSYSKDSLTKAAFLIAGALILHSKLIKGSLLI